MTNNQNPVTELNENSMTPMKKHHAWVAKAVCVFFAFLIWLYVMQVDNPEYTEVFQSLPVELLNTQILDGESGLSIYSGYGNTVDVTIIGKKKLDQPHLQR